MKVQNIVLAVASIGGAILTAALIRNGVSSKTVKAVPKVASEPEKYFKGVPLSKLTELAKQIYHGIYCSIDEWGFLIFHHNLLIKNLPVRLQSFRARFKLVCKVPMKMF